jgi:hypothetical protein
MTLYVTLVEDNDWEGETWRFYLPLEGNDGELRKLKRLIDDAGDESYTLDLSPIKEEIVDARVKNLSDDTSYMAAHKKFEGTFKCPPSVDDLYKGGIKDFFES